MHLSLTGLQNRFMELLWDTTLVKPHEVFDGVVVRYVYIPGLPSIERGNTGMMLHNKETDKVAIFISDSRWMRLTVFHEWREGYYFANHVDARWVYQRFMKQIDFIMLIYRKYKLGDEQKLAITFEKIRSYIDFHKAHICALLDEIDLARRELSDAEFNDYCNNIRHKDRFVLRRRAGFQDIDASVGVDSVI